MQTDSFVVVSRYKENLDWLLDCSKNHLVYNKGDNLPAVFNTRKVPNFGGNQYDIFTFCHEHYENLPETMVFLQGYPFDHCHRQKFDAIINNKSFTHVESTPGYPNGYHENNDNWYIGAHNRTWNLTCRFASFDEFMSSIFSNYTHVNICRFSPGSQYIVNKSQILRYPRKFWEYLSTLPSKTEGINGGTEAHVIERGMTMILSGIYNPVQSLS